MKTLFTLALLFSAACMQAQPFRTPAFTGNASSDFNANEKNFTSGTAYCMVWDASFIYFGVTGPGAYIKDEPTLIYIDTDPTVPATNGTGPDTGFDYDSRKPVLPFSANFVLFYKTGYAEVRLDSAGAWSSRDTFTTNIVTGTNDIEIKIPWTAFPGAVRPSAFSSLFFKENGNGSQMDAYEVRPGVNTPDQTYLPNINTSGPKIFYRLNTTENKYYPGINIFSWIDNTASTACGIPSGLTTTNITQTSAKLSWTAVTGAKQYLVRGRKTGTAVWLSGVVPGNKNSIVASGLLCNTNYEWHIRTVCDTSFSADINSGFSALKAFKTSACSAAKEGMNLNASEKIMIYPNPIHKGGTISVQSENLSANATYAFYNFSGMQAQNGILNGGLIKLNREIVKGIYILEIKNNASVTRNTIEVIE